MTDRQPHEGQPERPHREPAPGDGRGGLSGQAGFRVALGHRPGGKNRGLGPAEPRQPRQRERGQDAGDGRAPTGDPGGKEDRCGVRRSRGGAQTDHAGRQHRQPAKSYPKGSF